MKRLFAACLLVLLFGSTASAFDWNVFSFKYRVKDDYGRWHQPWQPQPYAEPSHWLDRHFWYDADELDRVNAWKRANAPTSWWDRMMR